MLKKQYFGFRVAKSRIPYLTKELDQGRLRQGWGWDEKQDLNNLLMDEGAKRNLPIKKRVKKGDILLVPHLPQYGLVTIAEATEDFDIGYRFELSESRKDLGHVFPAKSLKVFNPHHQMVSGDIRKTLKARNRFWNVTSYKDNINELIRYKGSLESKSNIVTRFSNTIQQAFHDFFERDNFSKYLFEQLGESFTAAEWEFVLVDGLQKLYPNYVVEHLGGKEEQKHGTDILIRIPHPLVEAELGIAIQVKDYEGDVDSVEDLIGQIAKADEHFGDNFHSLEKWLLFTKIDESDSEKLVNLNDTNQEVKVLFRKQVENLFIEMSEAMVRWRLDDK